MAKPTNAEKRQLVNSFVAWLERQAAKCKEAGRHHQDNQGCCHVCGIVLDEVLAAENGINVDPQH